MLKASEIYKTMDGLNGEESDLKTGDDCFAPWAGVLFPGKIISLSGKKVVNSMIKLMSD